MSDFMLSSKIWPGLGKLVEECGEVGQVAGKLMATGGVHEHWDGSDLCQRMHEELGDAMAAITFVISKNKLNRHAIEERMKKKLELYAKWAKEGQ